MHVIEEGLELEPLGLGFGCDCGCGVGCDCGCASGVGCPTLDIGCS